MSKTETLILCLGAFAAGWYLSRRHLGKQLAKGGFGQPATSVSGTTVPTAAPGGPAWPPYVSPSDQIAACPTANVALGGILTGTPGMMY
jgi:hypothetical protein